jgi:hypothetical protein
MIRRFLSCLALLACLFCHGMARADEQADYVLSRSAYALGGRQVLAGVHGLKVSWKDHAGVGAGRTVLMDLANGRMRMEWWKPGLSYGWILTRKGGWAFQDEKVRSMTPLERVEARNELRLRGFALYLGGADSVRVVSLPDRRAGDVRDHVLEATLPGGWTRRLVFDGGTYYLKSVESGPDSAAEVELLDDYRDVGDFFLAHRETRRAVGGEILEDWDISVVQSKPVFADTDFSPPGPRPKKRWPRPSHREKP